METDFFYLEFKKWCTTRRFVLFAFWNFEAVAAFCFEHFLYHKNLIRSVISQYFLHSVELNWYLIHLQRQNALKYCIFCCDFYYKCSYKSKDEEWRCWSQATAAPNRCLVLKMAQISASYVAPLSLPSLFDINVCMEYFCLHIMRWNFHFERILYIIICNYIDFSIFFFLLNRIRCTGSYCSIQRDWMLSTVHAISQLLRCRGIFV